VLKQLRTEASDGVNTDTIMLLRLPHGGGAPAAVSIPRDTYVPIPGYREDKINAAFGATKFRAQRELAAEGTLDRAAIERESDRRGRDALVMTVQDLTGARIDHYAEVSLYGFYLLTEAIGGVEVCLNRTTSDPDSGASFRKGVQTISGGAALSFVRQRENLPRGDLDRIVRQQVFLSSAMRRLLSVGTLTDPARFSALLDVVHKAVVVDRDLDIVELLRQVSTMASGDIQFTTIPVTGVGARNDRGQSIITVDVTAVKAFVAALAPAQPHRFAHRPAPPTASGARATDPSASTPSTVDGVRCVN